MHPSPEHPLKNGDMFAHLQDATAGSIESKGIANANDFLPVADIRRGGLSPSLPTPQDISIWNPNAMSQYNITESVTPFNLLGEAAFFWDPSPVGGKSSGNDTLGPTRLIKHAKATWACRRISSWSSQEIQRSPGVFWRHKAPVANPASRHGRNDQNALYAETRIVALFVIKNACTRPLDTVRTSVAVHVASLDAPQASRPGYEGAEGQSIGDWNGVSALFRSGQVLDQNARTRLCLQYLYEELVGCNGHEGLHHYIPGVPHSIRPED